MNNSDWFGGLATILTGAVAIIIYFRQKNDSKVQAARVLLTEIRTAEDRLEELRDKFNDTGAVDLPNVFPTKSWKNYSHLFVSDFDQDELKLISSFYDYGELVEDFAKRYNDFFWIHTEERARVAQTIMGGIVNESYSMPFDERPAHIINKRDYFSRAFDDYNAVYTPVKISNEIRSYLTKIEKITTSSCGLKLKKIAKLI